MSRKLIIAGNWKMNHTGAATRTAIRQLAEKTAAIETIDIVICPPFTSLATAVSETSDTSIAVGAQNVHWEKSGAYTGEVSAEMLTEIPVRYVIVGHSERRQYFAETDETVNKRLRAALGAGLLPIVCVGETLEERQAGNTDAVVSKQIAGSLANLTATDIESVVIAYEPVWAIGTGVTATPEQAQEVHGQIRQILRDRFDAATGESIRIQYGGSAKVNNVAELMSKPDIDGALVGGASLEPDDFSQLLANAQG